MRAVFMGTPAFAVSSLRALAESGHEIAAVITQPDRPAGRGATLRPPAVKREALQRGLPVFQPCRVKAPEVLEYLTEIRFEVIVVVAYGQIIPRSIIELPPLGCVNVHASLLPKYRGAAPINWAIANGEARTGVTTMLIEERLDAGDMLRKRETEIAPDETAVSLGERLAGIGAELLVETLAALQAGGVVPEKQNEDEASYAPILKRADGRVDWNLSAPRIFDRMRGFQPWPGTFTSFRGKRLHIHRARPAVSDRGKPGWLSVGEQSPSVGCGEGTALRLEEVQLEGKKRVSASDFVRGYHLHEGEMLGEAG